MCRVLINQQNLATLNNKLHGDYWSIKIHGCNCNYKNSMMQEEEIDQMSIHGYIVYNKSESLRGDFNQISSYMLNYKNLII